MPKYRQLHTKILDSFDVNDMPDDFTRLFWVLLPLILDSKGRGILNSAWIKARLFPLRTDVTLDHITNAVSWLSARGMIVTYNAEEHWYFYVPTFSIYQKGTQYEADSLLPSPPDEALRLPEGLIKPTSSQPPAAVYVYESESLKELNVKNSKIPEEGDVHRIFVEVTGMVSIPASDKRGEYIEAIYQMLQSYGYDDTKRRMKSAYDTWLQQHTKNGRQYSKTNLAWINFAVADETLGDQSGDELNRLQELQDKKSKEIALRNQYIG